MTGYMECAILNMYFYGKNMEHVVENVLFS